MHRVNISVGTGSRLGSDSCSGTTQKDPEGEALGPEVILVGSQLG